MTLRNHNAIMRSIDAERTGYDGWAPMGLAARQARQHLESMNPERRAQLEAEWEQNVEYV